MLYTECLTIAATHLLHDLQPAIAQGVDFLSTVREFEAGLEVYRNFVIAFQLVDDAHLRKDHDTRV